jgi:hypothetical protein
MNDNEVLLGKADALLLRLQSSANVEFPVLTEIVELSGLSGRLHKPPPPTPQSNTVNDVDVEELCQRLRIQIGQSLESAVKQWTDEIFLTRLRQEIESILQLSLERALHQSREAMLLRIEKALAGAIDMEIRTRLRPPI